MAPAPSAAARRAVTMAGAWAMMVGGLQFGCADPCCSTDGLPISLLPADTTRLGARGLTAVVRDPAAAEGAGLFNMAIDTGSSLTLFRRRAEKNEGPQVVLRNFDMLDARLADAGMGDVVRGQFRNIEALPLDLDASPGAPDAVLGGAFLKNFSVQFDFNAPSMTFWWRQGATDGFLANAGFAVVHFNLMGGAELTARSRPDFLGLTGPVEVPPTRVIFRGCGVPRAFDPVNEPQSMNRCCARGDEVNEATGADLSLLLATGVGPLVLSRSAWDRVVAAQRPDAPALPTPAPGDALSIPTASGPITDVMWSTVPRLALVDQESDDSTNQGACAELGRSRRLEWVERHHAQSACVQPCDTDPRESGKAQNAAAYVEIGGGIPVAVIPDGTPLLQGLRAEVRPEGPEIDGLIGAGVLAHMALEIDYKSQPARALFTCTPLPACAVGADRTICWTSPRCPRLSNASDKRACFCQDQNSLPAACLLTSGCE